MTIVACLTGWFTIILIAVAVVMICGSILLAQWAWPG